MVRQGGSERSRSSGGSAKLDELINNYNHAGQAENEAERQLSVSRARRRASLNVDRQTLLENGVPIDPELIKQVVDEDHPRVVVSHGADHPGGAKLVTTRLKASSGETIDTSRVTSRHDNTKDKKGLAPVHTIPDDDRTLSDKSARKNQREVKKVLKQARRRYGRDHYDRLNPNNYTQEKEAELRSLRRRRVVVIVAVIILLLAMAGGFVAIIMYRQANQPLQYSYDVCSEQDVVQMIDNYRNNDTMAITSYIDGKIGQDNYTADAKCNYIGALEFKLNNVKSGLLYQLDMYSRAVDRSAVDELIDRNDGASYDDLLAGAEKMKENDSVQSTDSGVIEGVVPDNAIPE